MPEAVTVELEQEEGEDHPTKLNMNDPTLGRRDYTVGPLLSRGSFGAVYPVKEGEEDEYPKVMKVVKFKTPADEEGFKAEAMIYEALTKVEPKVCPDLHGWGMAVYFPKRPGVRVGVLLMERCEGTAADYLAAHPEALLDYYEQVAKILQRLKGVQFNHRDLKSNNILYTLNAEGKPTFLVSDFGYACATLEGKEVSGRFAALEGRPPAPCFKTSRDLSQLVLDAVKTKLATGPLRAFSKSLLTFLMKTPDGRELPMDMTALVDKDARWTGTYRYLDSLPVENPNTTPEGLLAAIKSYRERYGEPLPAAPVAPEPRRELTSREEAEAEGTGGRRRTRRKRRRTTRSGRALARSLASRGKSRGKRR